MTFNKWDKRFIDMTKLVSEWSTCYKDYGHVGAIIVRDRRIVATGYNGAPAGIKTCLERCNCHKRDCGMEHGPAQCFAVHAEQNAILQAAKLGINIEGTTMYCTTKPCEICTKLIINSGIKRVIYLNYYDDKWADYLISELDSNNKVEFIQYKE